MKQRRGLRPCTMNRGGPSRCVRCYTPCAIVAVPSQHRAPASLHRLLGARRRRRSSPGVVAWHNPPLRQLSNGESGVPATPLARRTRSRNRLAFARATADSHEKIERLPGSGSLSAARCISRCCSVRYLRHSDDRLSGSRTFAVPPLTWLATSRWAARINAP